MIFRHHQTVQRSFLCHLNFLYRKNLFSFQSKLKNSNYFWHNFDLPKDDRRFLENDSSQKKSMNHTLLLRRSFWIVFEKKYSAHCFSKEELTNWERVIFMTHANVLESNKFKFVNDPGRYSDSEVNKRSLISIFDCLRFPYSCESLWGNQSGSINTHAPIKIIFFFCVQIIMREKKKTAKKISEEEIWIFERIALEILRVVWPD